MAHTPHNTMPGNSGLIYLRKTMLKANKAKGRFARNTGSDKSKGTSKESHCHSTSDYDWTCSHPQGDGIFGSMKKTSSKERNRSVNAQTAFKIFNIY